MEVKMDNLRDMNETMVKYMVDSTRKVVEFNTKVLTDYVELTKKMMTKVPGFDIFTKN